LQDLPGASIAARAGTFGLLSSYDRKLTNDFLKKYELVAPSDAGIQGDNYGGAIPAEHSAAQKHAATDPLESNERLTPGDRQWVADPLGFAKFKERSHPDECHHR
jgi:hypothetical protein